MAAIHDEFNGWVGEGKGGKRSRAEVTDWLNAQGVEDHGKFKTAARQAKRRTSQTSEQKAAANAQRREAAAATASTQYQPALDASHETLSQALSSTQNPVKVEFTTDRSGQGGKWADRMVRPHAVPTFAHGSASQNMVVTVFHDDGQSTAFHLARPQTTAPLNTSGHSTGGRIIQQVVKSAATPLRRPPFTGTMNEGDRQTLQAHQNSLAKLEATAPPSVDVPPEMRLMGRAMQTLQDFHQENLNVVHRTDNSPQPTAETPVVTGKHLGRVGGLMRSAHQELVENDPQYAAASSRAVAAVEATRAHHEAVAKQRATVNSLAQRATGPAVTMEPSSDSAAGILNDTGLIEHTGSFSVQGGTTSANDSRIDSGQMTDYVWQQSDTPGMRQARSAMHLARAAGADSDTDAATHARRAEAAAGVKWGNLPSSAEVNPMAQGFNDNNLTAAMDAHSIAGNLGTRSSSDIISGSGNDEFAKAHLTARVAGQMRSNPLYAGAVGTGLAKSVKAMGGKTAPTSNVAKIASEAQAVESRAMGAGGVVGYPHAEYRRGITATDRDPMPPYHGDRFTDDRPEETGPMADIRNGIRAGLSTLIGHRNTRASRGR